MQLAYFYTNSIVSISFSQIVLPIKSCGTNFPHLSEGSSERTLAKSLKSWYRESPSYPTDFWALKCQQARKNWLWNSLRTVLVWGKRIQLHGGEYGISLLALPFRPALTSRVKPTGCTMDNCYVEQPQRSRNTSKTTTNHHKWRKPCN